MKESDSFCKGEYRHQKAIHRKLLCYWSVYIQSELNFIITVFLYLWANSIYHHKPISFTSQRCAWSWRLASLKPWQPPAYQKGLANPHPLSHLWEASVLTATDAGNERLRSSQLLRTQQHFCLVVRANLVTFLPPHVPCIARLACGRLISHWHSCTLKGHCQQISPISLSFNPLLLQGIVRWVKQVNGDVETE